MGSLQKSKALVGFYGDDLDPEEITVLLGASPTVGVRQGGTFFTGMGVEKVAPTGSWRIKANESIPENLDAQINKLLDCLTNDLDIWLSLSQRYRAIVFAGLWLESYNDGFELQPSTLLRVGERGLIINFDIYGQE